MARRPEFQTTTRRSTSAELLWDLLTFDRLLTGPVIHLIYWAGLALIVLGGFATLGGAVGVAMREDAPMGVLLALPVLIGGLLFLAAGVLIWRSFCEFYVAIFRISEDLKAMRAAVERQGVPTAAAQPAASPLSRPIDPAQPAASDELRVERYEGGAGL